MYLPIVGLAWLLIVGGYDLLGCAGGAQRPAGAHAVARGGRRGGRVDRAARHRDGAAQCACSPIGFALRRGQRRSRRRSTGARSTRYGEALIEAERPDDAIAAYEEALRLNPDQGSARIALGQIYMQQRRYDDAERVLEPATKHSEESVVAAALQNLGYVYQARGDLTAPRRPCWARSS